MQGDIAGPVIGMIHLTRIAENGIGSLMLIPPSLSIVIDKEGQGYVYDNQGSKDPLYQKGKGEVLFIAIKGLKTYCL